MKGNDMTDKAAIPLMQRYKDAVAEFRQSYALLAAADQRAGRSGFGPPPAITEFRHALANPGEAGSLQDDIRKVLGHK
jgi:hypothetical protein